MAARVVYTDIQAILDETDLTESQIAPYIVSANIMVNNVLGTGTTDILKEIERWLTAHMIVITRERQAIKEGAEGANIEYTGKFGDALNSTSYGQMVLQLDSTGAMAALVKKDISIYAITSFE